MIDIRGKLELCQEEFYVYFEEMRVWDFVEGEEMGGHARCPWVY